MTTKNTILCDDTIKIVITPKLEKIVGRSEAIALQQLHFCLSSNENNGKTYEDRRWIYNTYEEWHEKYIPHYSSGTIQRAFTKLEKLGIVASCQFEKNYGNRRKSYTINYDVMETLIADYDERHSPQKTPQKSTPNFIQSKHSRQIRFDSIPEITHQMDNVHTKPINVFSKIQPTLSNNANKMIIVWNETVGKDLNQNITAYPKLLNTLDTLLENYFNSDLEKWRNYCLKIASSKFLMGEVKNYRIRFSYATSENGLNEILYGDKFTFGDRVIITATDETQKTKSSSPFEHYQESEQALKLRELIQQKIQSTAIYESWYKPTYIYYNAETNEYTLFAATRFMMDRIKTMNEEIANKFSEFHFFNGQYPEEYFGTPVYHNNASEEVINATPDLSMSSENMDNAETSKEFLKNSKIYNDDINLNTHQNTLHIPSSNSRHYEVFEYTQHTHKEGEGISSRLHETKKAQHLRQTLKEKVPPGLYANYLKESYIFIDDNNNASLFIKYESHKEPIVTLLKETGTIFFEISVPPESCYTFYFSDETLHEEASDFIQHTSEKSQEDHYFSSDDTILSFSQKEITEGKGTQSKSNTLLQNVNHTDTEVNTPQVSKWYDHRHKMIRWSQQNDVFLTKIFPKITSNIFSFIAISKHVNNTPFKKRKVKNINNFEKLKKIYLLDHLNTHFIKFIHILYITLTRFKQKTDKNQYLYPDMNQLISFQ